MAERINCPFRSTHLYAPQTFLSHPMNTSQRPVADCKMASFAEAEPAAPGRQSPPRHDLLGGLNWKRLSGSKTGHRRVLRSPKRPGVSAGETGCSCPHASARSSALYCHRVLRESFWPVHPAPAAAPVGTNFAYARSAVEFDPPALEWARRNRGCRGAALRSL